MPGVRHARRPRRGRRPPLLPEPGLPRAAVAGVRPLRRARRDGHRGRRLGGPDPAPRARHGPPPGGLLRADRRAARGPGPVRDARAPRTSTPRSSGPGPAGRWPRSSTASGIPQVGESTAVDLARFLARRVRPDAFPPAAPDPGRRDPTRGSPRSRRSCAGSRSRSPEALQEVGGHRAVGVGGDARLVQRTRPPPTRCASWSRRASSRSVPSSATRARRTRTGRWPGRRSS